MSLYFGTGCLHLAQTQKHGNAVSGKPQTITKQSRSTRTSTQPQYLSNLYSKASRTSKSTRITTQKELNSNFNPTSISIQSRQQSAQNIQIYQNNYSKSRSTRTSAQHQSKKKDPKGVSRSSNRSVVEPHGVSYLLTKYAIPNYSLTTTYYKYTINIG